MNARVIHLSHTDISKDGRILIQFKACTIAQIIIAFNKLGAIKL